MMIKIRYAVFALQGYNSIAYHADSSQTITITNIHYLITLHIFIQIAIIITTNMTSSRFTTPQPLQPANTNHHTIQPQHHLETQTNKRILVEKPATHSATYGVINQPSRVILAQTQAQSQPHNQHTNYQFSESAAMALLDEKKVQELKAIGPTRRIEYVPYEQKYVQYLEQRIKVPVQRVFTDYYEIEHIIEYVPIEKEEIVYETQAKEVVEMRLQYVPVEQKIIHISDKNAKALGITEYVATSSIQDIKSSPLYKPLLQTYSHHATSLPNAVLQNTTARKSRTNFITCQGYDPDSNLKEIDRILSQSSVRGSRMMRI